MKVLFFDYVWIKPMDCSNGFVQHRLRARLSLRSDQARSRGVSRNMKKAMSCLVLFLSFFVSRGQEFENIEPFAIDPLKIKCSITLENPELDFYEINWDVPRIDSVSKKEGHLPNTELHCFVLDSSGIIGSSKGLSTPMRHCYFQTKDSIVEVFFRWRIIPYYSYPQDSSEVIISVLNQDPFNKTSHRGSEFESIYLAVNSTSNRKLTLFNDTNTVKLSYGVRSSFDHLGMPLLGMTYSCVILLERYYVSLKKGRIATGKKWIDRKGVKKIVKNADHYILVSPSVEYEDKRNHSYLGTELIKARKIRLKNFHMDEFNRVEKENYPY
jgi:hypothetical protein